MLQWFVLLRWLVLVVPIVVIVGRWIRRRATFVALVNKIPGPRTFPFVGNALQLIGTNSVGLFKLVMSEGVRLGPIGRVWVLHKAQVIMGDAKDVERVLKDMKFHEKSDNYRFLHPWMGHGLLTSHDEKWRIHRKVLTPAFHFNILHEFLPIFTKHAFKLTECLAVEPAATSKQGFDIFPYSSLCALDIICESSMGLAINVQDKQNSDYVHSVIRMNELLIHRYFSPLLHIDVLFNLSPTKRAMQKHLKRLNSFTDKVIAERRLYLKSLRLANGNVLRGKEFGERRRLAFLDLLLDAEAQGMEHMTQKDIRDQVSTFMFEGYDTVSTATSWAIFLIGSYPDVQRTVVEELQDVFGDSGRAPEMADLANLKYLERCIKEALRLYPSVAFFERSIKEDAFLEKYTIPAGCTVTINGYLHHRNKEYWPDPEKFDPDRFLPENSQGRHPYAYIPFSAGPRNCIGQKFALMEEKVVVSTVLRRFRVEATHSRDEAQLQLGMVLRPKNGLRIRLEEREELPDLRISSSEPIKHCVPSPQDLVSSQ